MLIEDGTFSVLFSPLFLLLPFFDFLQILLFLRMLLHLTRMLLVSVLVFLTSTAVGHPWMELLMVRLQSHVQDR